MTAPADPRAPVCQSRGTSRQGPQSRHRLSPARAGRAVLTGSTLGGVRCPIAPAGPWQLQPTCATGPSADSEATGDADVGSANSEVSGPPCQRSKAARGTRNCLPIRITGNPAPPSVRMNWRASSYAPVRPMRNTAAASSTVRKSGKGPPDTTRLELDVTPTYPPPATRFVTPSSPPDHVTRRERRATVSAHYRPCGVVSAANRDAIR